MDPIYYMHVIEVGAKYLLGDFEEVFQKTKHIVPIVIYKCKIYKNKDHYEQVGYIAIWKAFLEYRGNSLEIFQKMAYTYARNGILNELRKMKRFEDRIITLETEKIMPNNTQEDKVITMSKELVEDLYSQLSPQEVKIIVGLYIEGYTYTELANLLRISPHALKKKRDRLLHRLRKQKKYHNDITYKENVS